MAKIITKKGKKFLVGTKSELSSIASKKKIKMKTAQSYIDDESIPIENRTDELSKEIRKALGLPIYEDVVEDDLDFTEPTDEELDEIEAEEMDQYETNEDGPSDRIMRALEGIMDKDGVDAGLEYLEQNDIEALSKEIEGFYKMSQKGKPSTDSFSREFMNIWGNDDKSAIRTMMSRQFQKEYFEK